MAAQLKLSRQGYDLGSEISSLNLYANNAGFTVVRRGNERAVMYPDDVSIEETITLHVIGSSHDDLATKMQNLAAKVLEIIQHAGDVATQQNVWLVDQLPNETGARKAFIFDARFEIGNTVHGPPVSPGNFIQECRLVLLRGHWERDSAPSALTSSGVSCLGGSDNYGTIVGDIPARVANLRWKGDSGGGGPFYEFWTGFRTNRYGTVANFVPVWECEDGTNYTDASDDTTSETTTASPGGGSGAFVEVDFAGDASMVTRMVIEVDDVTSNYGDQRGTFMVLLRAKIDSGTTARVRLLDGFCNTSQWRTQSRVEVDNTNWFMYPLGTITIPPTLGYPVTDDLRKFALLLMAERTGGSGSLKMDCLVLIPMGEGFVHATGGETQYSVGDTRPSEVRHFPDGSFAGIAWTGGYPVSILSIDTQNYGLPVGAGTLYVVAQLTNFHQFGNTLDMEITYSPRWLMLRGSE